MNPFYFFKKGCIVQVQYSWVNAHFLLKPFPSLLFLKAELTVQSLTPHPNAYPNSVSLWKKNMGNALSLCSRKCLLFSKAPVFPEHSGTDNTSAHLILIYKNIIRVILLFPWFWSPQICATSTAELSSEDPWLGNFTCPLLHAPPEFLSWWNL